MYLDHTTGGLSARAFDIQRVLQDHDGRGLVDDAAALLRLFPRLAQLALRGHGRKPLIDEPNSHSRGSNAPGEMLGKLHRVVGRRCPFSTKIQRKAHDHLERVELSRDLGDSQER